MIRAVALALLLVSVAPAAMAQSSATSSEKVRNNPAAQYVLVKTVVGKAMETIDARAQELEPENYNLLKYCWNAQNVLGDWAGRADLTGRMVVGALQSLSWERDLVRAGYPAADVAHAVGDYEAGLVAAGFTDSARTAALKGLVTALDGLRHGHPGAVPVRAVPHCRIDAKALSLAYRLVPDDGEARFIPGILHQICQAQQLDGDDPLRCDYWLPGTKDGPMVFAGKTLFSVRWPDGAVAEGRFDPEGQRKDGKVTLRRPAVKAEP